MTPLKVTAAQPSRSLSRPKKTCRPIGRQVHSAGRPLADQRKCCSVVVVVGAVSDCCVDTESSMSPGPLWSALVHRPSGSVPAQCTFYVRPNDVTGACVEVPL